MAEKVLFPHNQRAVDAVRKSFLTEDRACVVHPTGTGKSFIIEGVAKDYSRVAVFAANTETLNAVRERDIDGEFRTYQSLLTQDTFEPDQYDLIVLDEFHRAGAEQWSLALEDLLNANPNAKVLGTSATPVRYLDDARDMSEELFNGNVVSRMDITDAWLQGLIPVPKYVTALPSFDIIEDRYEKYMNSDSFKGDEAERIRMRDIVEQGRVDWQNTYGAEAVMKFHLDDDTKKMIVFCDNIESCKEMNETISGWLSDREVRSYMINSQNANAGREMLAFKNDDFDGLKIIYTVNMLNEGVHVDGVDAVVMFRQTQSPTIYLQQMGRCLSSGKDRQPVVFDFVDNISTNKTRSEISFAELSDTFRKKRETISGERESTNEDIVFSDLVIEDNLLSFRELLSNFSLQISYKDRLQQLYTWAEEHHRLPRVRSNDKEEQSLYGFVSGRNRTKPEIIALREKFPSGKQSYEERLPRLYTWIEEHHRLPSRDGDNEEENTLASFMGTNRTKLEIIALREKFPSGKQSYEERLSRLYTWIEEHHCMPSQLSNDKEEKSFGRFLTSNRTKPEIIALREKSLSGLQSYEDRLQQLNTWVEEHHCMPRGRSNDKEEYLLANFVMKNRTNPEIIALREKFPNGLQSYEDRLQQLYTWVEERHCMPRVRSNDKEEQSLGGFMDRNHTKPEIKALREKYPSGKQSYEERLSRLYTWIEEHHRLPSRDGDNEEENTLGRFVNTNRTKSEIIALREKHSKIASKEQTVSFPDIALAAKQVEMIEQFRNKMNVKEIYPFRDGWALFRQNDGKMNYINPEGNTFFRDGVDKAKEFRDGLTQVMNNGEVFTYNSKGQEVNLEMNQGMKMKTYK